MPAATTISIESCWVMLSQFCAVEERVGQADREKDEDQHEADEGAIAPEDVQHPQAASEIRRRGRGIDEQRLLGQARGRNNGSDARRRA